MNKIEAVKYWVTIACASLLVAISYELRTQRLFVPGVPAFVAAILVFILGTGVVRWAIGYLLGKRSVRKYFIGKTWLEGYWLIRTGDSDKLGGPLSYPGILFLEYKSEKTELKSVTTRLDSNGNLFVVNSEVVFVREEGANVKYLNYFKINYPGPRVKYGMAFCEFSQTSHFAFGPNHMEGHVVLEEEGVLRRQSAQRIPDKKVASLQKQYGDEWMQQVLKSHGALLQNTGQGDA